MGSAQAIPRTVKLRKNEYIKTSKVCCSTSRATEWIGAVSGKISIICRGYTWIWFESYMSHFSVHGCTYKMLKH